MFLLIKLCIEPAIMTPRNNSATKKFLFDHVWGLSGHQTRYNNQSNKEMQVGEVKYLTVNLLSGIT